MARDAHRFADVDEARLDLPAPHVAQGRRRHIPDLLLAAFVRHSHGDLHVRVSPDSFSDDALYLDRGLRVVTAGHVVVTERNNRNQKTTY